jgi:hypothetical protein
VGAASVSLVSSNNSPSTQNPAVSSRPSFARLDHSVFVFNEVTTTPNSSLTVPLGWQCASMNPVKDAHVAGIDDLRALSRDVANVGSRADRQEAAVFLRRMLRHALRGVHGETRALVTMKSASIPAPRCCSGSAVGGCAPARLNGSFARLAAPARIALSERIHRE